MNGYLKQSTASQSRLIGPFVDDTDFKTAETALTIANTDIKLRANGTTLSNKNSGGGTHQVNGMYSVTWDATDTANVGELAGSVVVSGALPVFFTYVVLEEAVYDALFGASAPGYLQPATAGRTLVVDAAGLADANVVKLGPSGSGTAQTARDIGASVLLSSGSGTGQLDFTAGVVKANLAQILGTALTETAGLLAGGFKKFFNVSSPTGTLNDLPGVVPGAAGGLFIAGTNAATTVTTALTTTFTGNLTGSVASVTGAVGSVTGDVGGNVTGSIGSLAAQAKTDVKTQAVAALNTDTYAESAAVPAATATLVAKICWLATLARNKITQTATTQTLRNDGDAGNVSTSAVSDDGTTFTRNKWT